MNEEEQKKAEEETKRKAEEEAEKGSEEGAAGDPGKGDKSEALKEIERINAETEKLNKAIAENENAKARQKAGGITEAGQQPPKPKTEDEKWTEEAKKRYEGTGMDPTGGLKEVTYG